MSLPTMHYQRGYFCAARQVAGVEHGHNFVLQLGAPTLPIGTAAKLCQNWDYQNLNHHLKHCDDVALGQYLFAKGDFANLLLKSAPDRGVYFSAKQFCYFYHARFSAAHFLPNVPKDHKCGRLHGHGFGVILFSNQHTSEELARRWQRVLNQINGKLLNKIKGLDNPTSENLALWLFDKIPDLSQISIQETDSAACSFDGQTLTIYKQQTAECALKVGADYWGHSYVLRLHLCGMLDEYHGWLQDYADIKSQFAPLYQLLDHHELRQNYDIGSAQDLAAYIIAKLQNKIPYLSAVDVVADAHNAVKLYRQAPLCANIFEFC